MRGSAAFRVAVAPGGALAGPWVRNSLWTAARAVPSLDLRFADNKSLVDATTGASLVTFTRASSGTFVGSDGVLQTATTNEPRFDHNPTTGESLGLLPEEARTNLLLRSEEFATTWTATRASITSNSVTAPDGTTTADSLTEDTTASQTHVVTQSASISTATSYTFSCFAKANTRPSIRLSLGSAGFTTNLAATFNLQGGTVIGTSAGVTASITPFSNDWYRCSATATSTATASTAFTVFIGDSATTTNVTYTGDGTSGIYIWGAQLEAGAFPTSYIPTTSATATRAADVASITGSNFSSFYNQTEGTFFADSNQANLSPVSRIVSVSSNQTANRVIISRASASGGNINYTVTDAGITQVPTVVLGSSLAAGTSNKVAFVYKAADFAGSVNGLTPVTQGTGTVPGVLTQLTIGNGEALGSNPMTGTIKRLTFWPTRLANTTLQAIAQP